MQIRAKFACSHITKNADGSERVHLTPVYGAKGTANAEWSKWTPSGTLEMLINNPTACGKIEPGRDYFVDITLAPAEEPAS